VESDRFGWGEEDAALPVAVPHIGELLSVRRPVSDAPGINHGDLTGNVLFDSSLSPAVIDLTTG
jgi:hypothetical protein